MVFSHSKEHINFTLNVHSDLKSLKLTSIPSFSSQLLEGLLLKSKGLEVSDSPDCTLLHFEEGDSLHTLGCVNKTPCPIEVTLDFSAMHGKVTFSPETILTLGRESVVKCIVEPNAIQAVASLKHNMDGEQLKVDFTYRKLVGTA